MTDTTSPEVTTPLEKPKPLNQLSRKALMEMTRPYAEQALQITVDLMNNSANDSVRLGAAKTILNKVIPDLKAVELNGGDGEKLEFVLVYKPTKE